VLDALAVGLQGSACVYSRKVEYLYSLIYQTLDHLAQQHKRSQVRVVGSGQRRGCWFHVVLPGVVRKNRLSTPRAVMRMHHSTMKTACCCWMT